MATITSAANGNYSVGGTWVGGIAPVSGDKVIIAHTSTGLAQFSTNTAGYAIGATAITLTGSVAAGSYVIGENVQFAGDPNYYTITNWVSGTKVLTVAPLIVAIPASATLVTTRGHIVTVDTTVAGGDDTSTGITINGTLMASRTATSQLTARGDILINTSGTLDYGTEADPIPSTYTATLIINNSAAPAHNKWGIRTIDTEQFMKAIKDIPAPIVNVTTESVDIQPIITEIKSIGKIKDIEFPEYPKQKEPDMSGMEKCMEEIEEKIENIPDNTEMIKKIVDFIDKKEQEERMEEQMKEEEENMNRPLPNSFIAELN